MTANNLDLGPQSLVDPRQCIPLRRVCQRWDYYRQSLAPRAKEETSASKTSVQLPPCLEHSFPSNQTDAGSYRTSVPSSFPAVSFFVCPAIDIDVAHRSQTGPFRSVYATLNCGWPTNLLQASPNISLPTKLQHERGEEFIALSQFSVFSVCLQLPIQKSRNNGSGV